VIWLDYRCVSGNGQSYVYTVKPVCLQPFSETLVEVRCPKQFAGRDGLIESLSSKQFNQYAVSRSLYHPDVRTNKAVVRVMNIRPQAYVIKKGDKIAAIQPINVKTDCIPFTEGRATDALTEKTVDPAVLKKFAAEYDFKTRNAFCGTWYLPHSHARS